MNKIKFSMVQNNMYNYFLRCVCFNSKGNCFTSFTCQANDNLQVKQLKSKDVKYDLRYWEQCYVLQWLFERSFSV